MKYLKFNKEINGKWYVILPEWTGSKDDLEMVLGADTMLDILAQGDNFVEITIDTKPFSHNIELSFKEYYDGGAWYGLKSDLYDFDVWLCKVTKFVFGELPKKIYIK